ncbi:MAG: hypothetical protein GKR95_00910 [Gammaproteobacteria bacterium]|nr:hypothetical protein [Gammaproteobacteria bacterium]
METLPKGMFDYMGACLAFFLVSSFFSKVNEKVGGIFKKRVKKRLEEHELSYVNRVLAKTLGNGDQTDEEAEFQRLGQFNDKIREKIILEKTENDEINLSSSIAKASSGLTLSLFLFLLVHFFVVVMLVDRNYAIEFSLLYEKVGVLLFILTDNLSTETSSLTNLFGPPFVLSLIFGVATIMASSLITYRKVVQISRNMGEELVATKKKSLIATICSQYILISAMVYFLIIMLPVIAPFYVALYIFLVILAAIISYTIIDKYIKVVLDTFSPSSQ